MPFGLFTLAKREKNGRCGPLVSIVIGMYGAVGSAVIMVFVLYMTLLMSPDLLRRILQDLMQCEDFPGYLSPNFTSADTIEFSGLIHSSSETRSLGPAPADAIPSSEYNATVARTLQAPENRSHAENSPAIAPEFSGDRRKLEKFSVLVGILTTARTSDRRQQVRLAYSVQSSDEADFTVRFVLGAVEKEEERVWVGMENATFGDIIVLPCKENMNAGKTFTYFTTLVAMGVKYDYVMKTDDDSYVRFSNLGKQLSPMPRTDLYYGYSLPCGVKPNTHFLAGAGYMISWDLVLWINNSPIPRNRSIGTEDILVGDWFREGGVAKNRPFSKGLFHDYPSNYTCAHELSIDAVLVHKLKTTERWHLVVAFFEKDRLSKFLDN